MTVKEIHSETRGNTYCGDLTVSVYPDGKAMISLCNTGYHGNIHITLEDAKFLRDALDRGISKYEAGVDRYHDVCDEPPVQVEL